MIIIPYDSIPLTEPTERVKGTRKSLNVIIVLINKEQKPPHSEHFIKRHSSFVVDMHMQSEIEVFMRAVKDKLYRSHELT